jgi:hypothetical protein
VSISVRPYGPNDADVWDAFCGEALQATLLHMRRFLSYHGDRFEDRSLILEEDGKLVGLFPAAPNPSDKTCVVSHPGITYGGVIHQGSLRGERMINALKEIRQYYFAQGYMKLVYKAVPTFYHLAPAQDDLYALFGLEAHRIRCDLSSTIDLRHHLSVSERRRRGLRKALKAGVEVFEGHQYLAALWKVLENNLDRKHGVIPVHNLDEITLLAERFPDNIRCICAVKNSVVIAGTLLFVTPTTFHAQYIASSQAGYECSALDAVFEHGILSAHRSDKRWFDFGISTESDGKVLNEGLYRFKSEFGAGSVVHEFYELSLTGEHHAAI